MKAKLEAVTFRVRATAATAKPNFMAKRLTQDIPDAARAQPRRIYWRETHELVETPVYRGANLLPGNSISGPAVIETSDTTVIVHPGRKLSVDHYGNLEMVLET